MRRTLLFLATNLAIVMVLGAALSLTGLDAWLVQEGIGFYGPLAFAAIFGMGGSFISLALSKWMAKRATGAQLIEQPRGETEAWLVQTVSRHAQAAGIGMPEVAIFPSDSPNAFATGARRDHALVAVSTGLLQGMSRDEVDGVIGHEISHIANGDMITLTLIQGVVNTFVLFFARVIGYYVDRVVLKNERGYGIGYFATTIVAQLVLGILASIIVFWFSRRREFRADAGGARLAGREKMIAALERLRSVSEPEPLPEQMQAFGISGGRSAFARLFATHPPLTQRIERLRMAQE